MVLEKLAVNGMAAAVSIFDVVPKADTRFAKLPAKIDFFTAIECREIDKPCLYVFQMTADFLNPFDGRLDAVRGRVLAGTDLLNLIAG